MIRPARLSDLAEVSELDRLSFSERAYPSFVVRQLFDVAGPLFMLSESDDGHIGGYVVGLIATESSVGWIPVLGVHPTRRRCGIARSLMHAVMSELANCQRESVRLTVEPGNVPALQLFTVLGFRKVSLSLDYFGSDEPRVLMEADLR